ncbi:MAG: TetR/AcrR family transcriptional regulator [Pseudomonadota bacterium]
MSATARPLGHKDEKTAAIIVAARKTFLSRGFDAASMDQIALEASVSKRTVYNRFRSKEELFAAAIEDSCERFLPVEIEAIEETLPAADFLMEMSREFLKSLFDPEALSLRRLAAFEADRTPAIGKSYLEFGPRKLVAQCAPIVARLADRGDLDAADAEIATWQLGALITEPLHTFMLLGDPPEDLDAAIDKQAHDGVRAFLKLYGAPR